MKLRILDYYATLDAGDLDAAVAMLADDVEYAMVLPTGVSRKSGRAAMLEYLNGRPPVDRKHRLLRSAADGDLQFAHGAVTEGDRVTGYFVGSMHLDANGLVDRYQVSFDAEFALLPDDSTQKGT
ncbi:nuclear transport factor 2 family protein [Rhodococcus sp. BP-252]|uniref:SnoaL-like domain-containing protein n=1 Tax=Rhodococcoides kyotonense TaxID=398843 RepID=A0A177YMS5_9NOCA|nr:MULTISPECIES: nuclear transport factor 2 family protein [Rhodococcus]MBY6412173.1 nuclear transport factor 2 family protein [Rhodococcus sp. BP-320]MBY6416753.1 nuclear transport factor 2 family protein [Rhodococcus sp. BP-321]MBY6421058.1 nuclear transport factor 2 family protein [Rhodococcus sp. BP-324]MBY6426777.1 nuclear transport factor 2 family protein [Rhodococcus sp. BP-323]MBY6431776.1 nuclear transport factor 2 family protein [Rhodococcus sp. BP-322]